MCSLRRMTASPSCSTPRPACQPGAGPPQTGTRHISTQAREDLPIDTSGDAAVFRSRAPGTTTEVSEVPSYNLLPGVVSREGRKPCLSPRAGAPVPQQTAAFSSLLAWLQRTGCEPRLLAWNNLSREAGDQQQGAPCSCHFLLVEGRGCFPFNIVVSSWSV